MKRARAMTDGEIEAVLQAFTGPKALRDKALFMLGVKTGFRVSELLSLTVRDVCQQDGTMVDVIHVPRRAMKGRAASRSVVLHADAKTALGAWLRRLRRQRQASPTAPLFPSCKRQGRQRVAIGRVQAWYALRAAYSAAGLTGTLGTHAMRKSFATRVYARLDHDLVSTQRALGHKNINSTVAYLRVDQARIDAAILA